MVNPNGKSYNSVLVGQEKTRRIKELDGLRACAVALVVLYHSIDSAGVIPNVPPQLVRLLVVLGQAGVHIFFVISGFIITSLLLREAGATGGVALVAFYQRRFFRIFPPLAAYLVVLFILFKLHYILIKPLNFLWCLLFLGDFEPFGGSETASGWFFGHTWSLSVEEQFYLIIPFVLAKAVKFNVRRTTFLLVASLLFCLLSLKLAKEASLLNPVLWQLSVVYEFRYIIVGVLFALHQHRVLQFLSGRTRLLPVCLAFFIVASNLTPRLPGFVAVPLSGLEAVSYGYFILWFVTNPAQCAALRWKWVQWLGASSYSIYLWQQLFTGKASFYKGWTVAQSPYALLVILACAALSYYLVELPSIRLGRSVATKGRPLAPTGAGA